MRILIADDHRLIVEGVKLKLGELGPDTEFVIAMDMAELREALHAPDARSLALALIDLAMPGVRGNEHLAEVIEQLPHIPVIVLSGSEDAALMKSLLAMGVQGFIPKAYSPEVMLSAVRLVLSGGVYVPPLLLQERGDSAAASAGNAASTPLSTLSAAVAAANDSLEERLRKLLTERQIDVLRLLSQGKPNKLIARDLGISEGTVKIHLAAIFRALNVRNRVEAVVASRRISGL
ncbi:response regulator transcription factor [Dyella sp. ASV21]|uniref:LuxR C-terminal-related transcriptional regulator n=1 Tax=Dyella sp. ASV21 TaxID=2795114 RepID=UPI001E2D5050|nr:response regulator transcription factor [Dyella sp. ASV21]